MFFSVYSTWVCWVLEFENLYILLNLGSFQKLFLQIFSYPNFFLLFWESSDKNARHSDIVLPVFKALSIIFDLTYLSYWMISIHLSSSSLTFVSFISISAIEPTQEILKFQILYFSILNFLTGSGFYISLRTCIFPFINLFVLTSGRIVSNTLQIFLWGSVGETAFKGRIANFTAFKKIQHC